MRKTLTALALSTLALLPAASAWAGGSADDAWSREVQKMAMDAAPDANSVADAGQLIASGCHNGVVFVFDFSTGTITAGGSCTVESLTISYVLV